MLPFGPVWWNGPFFHPLKGTLSFSENLVGLAPRLNKLDGKTIHLSICGEADIWVPLEKKLKSDYPNVNWRTKKTYTISPVELSEEEMKTAQGVIQAVCW